MFEPSFEFLVAHRAFGSNNSFSRLEKLMVEVPKTNSSFHSNNGGPVLSGYKVVLVVEISLVGLQGS